MQDVETYDKHWVLAIPYIEMNKISLTNERSQTRVLAATSEEEFGQMDMIIDKGGSQKIKM